MFILCDVPWAKINSLPAHLKELYFGEATKIQSGCFTSIVGDIKENDTLASLYFPDGSDFSGMKGAFNYYNNLCSVELEGDINLPERAFSNCAKLSDVTFHGTSVIKNGSFNKLPMLTNITFEKATSVSQGSFQPTIHLAQVMAKIFEP